MDSLNVQYKVSTKELYPINSRQNKALTIDYTSMADLVTEVTMTILSGT